MPSDGTISYNDFRVAAHAFSQKWIEFNSHFFPNWSWITTTTTAHQVNDGYLSLENFVKVISSSPPIEEEEEEEEELTVYDHHPDDDVVDEAILVSSSDHHDHSCEMHHHRYEFHIVYSSSFRVPVLYFRAYDTDGQIMLMNEIEMDLSSDSLKLLMESKWTFITLEDHPQLNRPWYMLHPCATSEWMKLLLENDSSRDQNGAKLEHYLVSWLSVVGQVFKLKLPIEMLKDSPNPPLDKDFVISSSKS
ncbi:ubiquitin-like-conjugating enzyme ATG10 [Impatiens glandulifera]|uniref:ubiquitin-like-conjugating enzyme ATG10 n=1 Tax=Impatiens glandulifera TaxID=253017 RepID=UPI001FB138B4|nr:ubiquitin-like-conjugating enzyme ATG10 [Impatiens glandulifera]